MSVSSCVCCATLPAAAAVAEEAVEASCELEAFCAGVAPEAAPFVVATATEEVEAGGSADVFVVLNNPAACAVESADSVRDDSVKVSCGSAEVDVVAAAPLEAFVVGELCACCVDCWLCNPPPELTTFVTDMTHLRVAEIARGNMPPIGKA